MDLENETAKGQKWRSNGAGLREPEATITFLGFLDLTREDILCLKRSRFQEEKEMDLTVKINKYVRRGENKSDTCRNLGVITYSSGMSPIPSR